MIKLTDEQIKLVCRTGMWDDSWQSVKFARAIEAEVLRINDLGVEAHDDAKLQALGWQRISCPVCGADGARAAPQPQQAAPGGFPQRIMELLRDVADRKGTETRGPWEDGNGEPMQDDADTALAWISSKAAPGAVLVGWQSIETAPKDGEAVLVHIQSLGETIRAHRDEDGNWHGYAGEKWIGNFATHWMPLPAAPSAPKPQGE